jgi:hypothetical protein
MEFLLIWTVLAIVVGIVASNKGRSGFGWFLLSMLISPLLSGLLVLAMSRKGMTAHDQLLFDAMSDEQQQRVIKARSARETPIRQSALSDDHHVLLGLFGVCSVVAAAVWFWH